MKNTRLAAYCFVSAVGGYISYRVVFPSNGASIYVFAVIYFLVFLAVEEYHQTVGP